MNKKNKITKKIDKEIIKKKNRHEPIWIIKQSNVKKMKL
jgi:hypothetical protein